MPAVANAPADQEWSHCGLGQHAESHVVGKATFVLGAIHLGEFEGADGVYLPAHERWQSQQVVKITSSEKIVLISEEFVAAVGGETRWASQEI